VKAYDVAYRVGFGHVGHVTVIAGNEAAAVKKAMADAKRQGYVSPPEFVSLTALPRLLP
jgi:hypothetical protein